MRFLLTLGVLLSCVVLPAHAASPDFPESSSLAKISAGEKAVTMGSIPSDLIRLIVQSHEAELAACHEKALEKDKNAKGRIGVRFVITPTGKVSAAAAGDKRPSGSMAQDMTLQIQDNTTGSKVLEECVTSKIVSWLFPKPKGGGIVVVTFPFLFD